MRKTLAIILSIVMLASICAIGVAAEGTEPTLITSAADFALIGTDETTLAGNYKLTADIDIGSGGLGGTFKGTFDGDGHTITITDTSGVFSTISGATISNLVIKGKITATGNAGALANTGNNGFKVINVVNYADVSSTGDSAYVGGIIGSVSTGSATATSYPDNRITDCVNHGKIHAGAKTPRVGGMVGNQAKYAFTTYTGCVNNGDIDISQDEGKTALTGASYSGGMTGGSFGGKYENCLNKGNITASLSSDMGGIVGRCQPSSQGADQSVTILNCTNEGNLLDHGRGAGGMIGYTGELSGTATAIYTIKNCVNKGNITMESAAGSYYAGGIVAYIYGQGKQYPVIEGCVNYGTIKSITLENNNGYKTWASQIMCYVNSSMTQIKGCVGAGKIEATYPERAVFIGFSSADFSQFTLEGNTLAQNDGTVNYAYTATEANSSAICTLADAGTTKVAVKTADEVATKISTMSDLGYVAPKQDPEPPVQPPVTGDNITLIAVVATVSVIGMGIAFKAKRKEN